MYESFEVDGILYVRPYAIRPNGYVYTGQQVVRPIFELIDDDDPSYAHMRCSKRVSERAWLDLGDIEYLGD